ncbi:iron-sulfur cluster assembly protein IscA [Dunaliella salina]|uniref:Iron-sulfur cluster assembly protein IscA n=1 Tax=Dunaliella salina TaxID=3046 RepID=A0ABQ7GDH1_DUNSA|nr:iron-sulfur cluster assembly protein IscA [Dunaliella salina]|eukprot:KAF5832650.1 iron-sulfur cluster assembly protein IscA [Dunaliella salina]
MRPSLVALAAAVKQAAKPAAEQAQAAAPKPARPSPRIKKQALELSDEAAARIKQLLEARQMEYLRVGVKKRGCSGLSYTLNYAENKGKFDELVDSKGVKLLIEPTAVMHLLGTRMNFVEDKLKSEFQFENPNSKGSCGCGESFTT